MKPAESDAMVTIYAVPNSTSGLSTLSKYPQHMCTPLALARFRTTKYSNDLRQVDSPFQQLGDEGMVGRERWEKIGRSGV